MAAKAKRKRSSGGGLDTVLGPILSGAVLVVALVHSLLDRASPARRHNAPAPAPARGPAAAEERTTPAKAAEPQKPGIKARLGRVPVLGYLLRVQQRYSELRGNNLASAVTFQAFISLFPLLLLIVAVVGFVAAGSDTDVAGRIVANLGLSGEAESTISDAVRSAEENRGATAPFALLGLLWSGLGLVGAFQYAFDQVWQVEDRGLKDKAFGVLWLAGAALLFVGASAVTTVLNWLPGFVAPLGLVVGLLVNFGLWLWTFKVLPNRDLPWGALVPGAAVGAVGMELLKVVGGIYVPKAVSDSSALYGTLGVVFAVLAWLLVFGKLALYATVVNVMRWEGRAGTVRTTIEVPAGSEIQASDDVTRAGRLERDDVKT